jgi:hypothetical protein
MKTEAVDLLAFVPADTAVLEILKPGGIESTGWTITFAGPSHDKTIAWQTESSRKNLRRQQQIEAAQVNGRKYKPEERGPDEQKRENVAWIVARIVDWSPVRLGPGDPVAFSETAAMELLMRPDLGWAFVQMVEFLVDERSFTKASATI